MKEGGQVKHQAAEWRERRQRCAQVVEMRARLATVEFKQRMSATEHATVQLG